MKQCSPLSCGDIRAGCIVEVFRPHWKRRPFTSSICADHAIRSSRPSGRDREALVHTNVGDAVQAEDREGGGRLLDRIVEDSSRFSKRDALADDVQQSNSLTPTDRQSATIWSNMLFTPTFCLLMNTSTLTMRVPSRTSAYHSLHQSVEGPLRAREAVVQPPGCGRADEGDIASPA